GASLGSARRGIFLPQPRPAGRWPAPEGGADGELPRRCRPMAPRRAASSPSGSGAVWMIRACITLDEATAQVSIEHSNPPHDARLIRLSDAAEKWATNFLNVESLADLEGAPQTSPPSTFPEDVKSAILLHVEAEFDRDERNFELILKR